MSKKNIVSRLLCFILTLILLLPSIALMESKAAGFIKCYTISSGYTNVYSGSNLKIKIGTIYPSDELRINVIDRNYCKVTYPIAKGSKTGYIPTSTILLATGGYPKEATKRITTYRRNSTGKSYGYIEKGDKVLELGQKGNFTQIYYPVSGGHKIAWIRSSEASWKGAENVRPIADGIYRFETKNGMRLDVNGASHSSGANIQLWEKNDSDAQIFKVEYQNNGYYKITNVASGKVLDIDGGNAHNGANVIQYGWHGGPNQQWKIVSSGESGYYCLLSAQNTTQALDISGGIFKNGTNVQSWEKNNSDAQKWKLVLYNEKNNTTSNTIQKLSYGLYKNSRAYISCKFDGYTTTKGRHEGIDFVCYQNAPVYSLTNGTVVRVQKGSNGSRGLSTIAIYDNSTNKTVIYLHTNPLSLKVGQNISKGQLIATQGWRGVSSSSGSHTHVEVRNGKQTSAAKSVNDYKLDNPNPNSYWNSKGYSIQ